MSKAKSAIFCRHANEVSREKPCICPGDCYCKTKGTCYKNKTDGGEASKKIVKCETCNFFELFDEGEGFCRRNAPKALLVNVDTGHVKRSKGEIEENAAWSIVQCLDWCGEWEEESGIPKGLGDEEETEEKE